MKGWFKLVVVLELAAEVEARTRVQDGVTTRAGLGVGAVAVVPTGLTRLHQHVNVPQCAVSINI